MISLIITYYNQEEMLNKQLKIWDSYSDETKNQIHFIIVDDASTKEAEPIIKSNSHTNLNISLLKIKEDIYCNIPGAMNLGSKEARTPWLLHMDMDHYFDEDNVRKVIHISNNEEDTNKVFKFNRDVRKNPEMLRKNPSGFKFHPKLCLISYRCYWNIGGFDEDFSGHYGRTDTAFFTRGEGKFTTTYLNEVLLCMDKDGDALGINRKDLTHNSKLLEEKRQNKNWSNEILRFNWEKIKL